MTEKTDRSMVKKYFKGSIGPIVTIIVGILVVFFTFGLVLLAGIIWLLVEKYGSNKEAEARIDSIIQAETQRLKERAMQKLNIVEEQVKIIDPIYLYGPSYDPNPETASGGGTVAAFFKRAANALNKGDDPVWASKVGSDGVWRYSLIEITVLLFDEEQMFIYYGYLDLTTGTVFREGTYEYFYQDILSVHMNQTLVKLFNAEKKKYERRLFEYLSIYTAGCSHKASYHTNKASSHIDSQFTAMRNLIRDKKINRMTQNA